MDDISPNDPYEVKNLGEKNRVYLPDKFVEELGWQKDEKIAIIKQKDRLILAKVKALQLAVAMALMAVVMAASIMPNMAFAQQTVSQASGNAEGSETVDTGNTEPAPSQATPPPAENNPPPTTTPPAAAENNSTDTTTTSSSNGGESSHSNSSPTATPGSDIVTIGTPQGPQMNEIIVLKASAAYLPFTLQITYPSGVSKIENVTHVSPYEGFATRTIVGSPGPGSSVFEFTTGTVDLYSIRFGQVYREETTGAVNIVAYSNSSIIFTDQEFFSGKEWTKNFVIETTYAPVMPTAEDLNRLNEVHFDKLERLTEANTNTIDGFATTIGQMANAAYSSYSFHAIAAVALGIVAMAVWQRRPRESKLTADGGKGDLFKISWGHNKKRPKDDDRGNQPDATLAAAAAAKKQQPSKDDGKIPTVQAQPWDNAGGDD